MNIVATAPLGDPENQPPDPAPPTFPDPTHPDPQEPELPPVDPQEPGNSVPHATIHRTPHAARRTAVCMGEPTEEGNPGGRATKSVVVLHKLVPSIGDSSMHADHEKTQRDLPSSVPQVLDTHHDWAPGFLEWQRNLPELDEVRRKPASLPEEGEAEAAAPKRE